MKKYGVYVRANDGISFIRFFEKYSDARNYAMNAECGCGWYSEIMVLDELNGLYYSK